MAAFLDSSLAEGDLERARAGDSVAHEAIYRAFARPVFTLARRLVPHRAAAEDLTQDIFVEVLSRLAQYEARGSFAGWVRAIAVHKCLMHLRSPWWRCRRWLDGPAETDEFTADLPAAASGDAGDAVDLERALTQLPDIARAVVWLHDVEGYTHAEIGALFGGTASFSKSQLARAHDRLRAALHSGETGANACMPVSTSY